MWQDVIYSVCWNTLGSYRYSNSNTILSSKLDRTGLNFNQYKIGFTFLWALEGNISLSADDEQGNVLQHKVRVQNQTKKQKRERKYAANSHNNACFEIYADCFSYWKQPFLNQSPLTLEHMGCHCLWCCTCWLYCWFNWRLEQMCNESF